MGKEWGVGGHVNDICIPLESCHEGSFVDTGACMVPFLPIVVAGVFSGENLGSLSLIVVIAVHVIKEPVDGTIKVLVHQICLLLPHGFPSQVKVLSFGIGP